MPTHCTEDASRVRKSLSAKKSWLDLSWCNAPKVRLPTPNIVLYLDITPEIAAECGDYGEERYEQLDFQNKVANQYKALHDPTWQIVDASMPIDDIHEILKGSLSMIMN